ncbi:hypothetical protein [Microbulbifer guangxiensis]|uniref:hypothetical protein n=1 Tax=Microbulbifer guangxiensis TaxID=2904249 RepID=UPI001F1CF7E2|nr:hypothetical protein [Microbulbifer guangxiensis]
MREQFGNQKLCLRIKPGRIRKLRFKIAKLFYEQITQQKIAGPGVTIVLGTTIALLAGEQIPDFLCGPFTLFKAGIHWSFQWILQ